MGDSYSRLQLSAAAAAVVFTLDAESPCISFRVCLEGAPQAFVFSQNRERALGWRGCDSAVVKGAEIEVGDWYVLRDTIKGNGAINGNWAAPSIVAAMALQNSFNFWVQAGGFACRSLGSSSAMKHLLQVGIFSWRRVSTKSSNEAWVAGQGGAV